MARPKPRPPQRPRLLVEELEPRILYSADAAALLGASGMPGAAMVREFDPAAALSGAAEAAQASSADMQEQGRREIIFIDSRVPDAMTLADQLMQQRGTGAQFDIVMLDADDDGVAQINHVLANEHGLAAIHIISHGSDGAIDIGATRLDTARLAVDGDSVARWGKSLVADGDLLLYGCDVAQGAVGQAFVQNIARLTGADVAASSDLTGSVSIGGNWTLEFATGTIHTQFTPRTFENLSWEGVLATFTVTSTADTAAAGTFRWAITQANSNGVGLDTIDFAIAGTGVHTINITSALPTISGAVTIDATTDDSFAPNGNRPAIILDGNNAFTGNGLVLSSTADGSTIRGLVIRDFTGDGIVIQAGSDGNTIAGNYIGRLTSAGIDAGAAEANTGSGIRIFGANNTIGGASAADRNVISGNANDGVTISDVTAQGNVVLGNWIGINATGVAALGNGAQGVWVGNGAANNTIGGTAAGSGNVIGASAFAGIEVNGTGTSGNLIQGNYIGTDATGTLNFGVGNNGVYLVAGASGNTIGGTAAGAGNTIARNGANGVVVTGATTTGNAILGNSIYSNASLGIDLAWNGITNNDGGDADTGANNLQNFPVLTSANANATGTTISGSLNSIANTVYRIEFFASRPSVADSPNGEGERYLGSVGVLTDGSGNKTFTTTLANVWINAGDRVTATATNLTTNDTSEFGVNITATSTGIVVVDTISDVADGTTTSITNLGNNRGADGRISLREAIIAANNTAGIDRIVFNIPGSGVQTINVGAAGLPTITSAVIIDGWSSPNYAGSPVIELNGGNLGTLIKGITLGAGSDGSTVRGLIINRFSGTGIEISGSNNHTIQGNWIGLDSTGTAAAANGVKGLYALNSTGNLIGGTTAAERNVISGNAQQGIYFDNVDSSIISGNYVGTNAAGTGDVSGTSSNSAQSGIFLTNGSSGNVIGGTTAGARNVISGNNHYGFEVLYASSQDNLLQGNYIGTTADGKSALGNTGGGASFWGAGTGNVFGGGAAGAGNVISGNISRGVLVGNATTGATIQGNLIGVAADGVTLLGNGSQGIKVEGGSTGTRIGTDANGSNDAAERNVISGNATGVVVTDSGTNGTVIAGNIIGLGADGSTIVANSSYGVSIVSSAGATTIGGATSVSRNVISGNTSHGVYFASSTSGSSVLNNYIGTNAAGNAPRANLNGIWVDGSANNIIGQSGAGNLISGNTYWGVAVDGAGATGTLIRANLIGTDAAGTANLGNGGHGVRISNGASTASIGGTAAGQGNTIAFNSSDGVFVESGVGVAILGNSIHGNATQGIDLDVNGVTPNDAGDADSGANNLQNFPVLSYATTTGTQVTVTGGFNSLANTQFRIEFFASSTADGTGYGEGQRYLGFANVTTDGSGNAVINSTLTASVALGEHISATATKSNAGFTVFTDTSEFAQNVVAAAPNTAPSDIVFDSESTAQTTVNTYTASDQNQPAIAALPNGGYVVVWVSDAQDGSLAGIYGQRFDAAGAKVGAEFLVTSESVDAETSPSVSAFSDGGFVVAWQDQTSGVYAWTEARVFNADGSPATAEFKVSPGTDGNGEGYQPAVQVLDGTRFVVVWSNEIGGSTYQVAGRIYDRAGTLQGSQFTVGSLLGATALFGAQPEVTLLNDGGFAVAWRTYNGSVFDSRLRIMNGDGTARSTEIVLGGDHRADVSGLKNGNLVVVYGASTDIRARIYDAAGNLLVGPFTVNTSLTGNQLEPTVTRSDDGFVVVWQSDNGGATTDLFAQRFDAVGTRIGGEVLVNTTLAGNQSFPEVIESRSGQVRVAWESENVDGSGFAVVSRVIGTGNASVAENASNGTRVADVLGVFDADVGDTATYSLTNSAGGRFAINATTGVITVANAALLDYETNATHTITVRVTDGGGLAYDEVLTILVLDVNDAPTLGNGTLAAVNEDTASPAGQAVSTIFAGQFADVDAGSSFGGIAVVGNTANASTQGTWQYSTNSGSNWFAIGTVADGTTALALSTSTLIRFVPVADYNGSPPALVVRGLDNSYVAGFSSTAGSETRVSVNTSSNGGTTAVAAATATLSTTVTAVNDAPTISNGATIVLATTNEDTTSSATTVDTILSGASWADVDSGALKGIAITARTGSASGSWQYSTDGSTWTAIGSVSATNALLLTSTSLVRYVPDAINAEVATFSFRAWDQTSGSASSNGAPSYANPGAGGGSSAYSSQTASASITVSAVNDAPVVTTSGGAAAYVENAAAIVIDAGVTVTDVDHTNMNRATVTITANYASGQDVLAFVDQNGISGSWDAGTGVLTLTGSASKAFYEAALRSVTYVNTSEAPSTAARTVSFVVRDTGNLNSAAATRTINVTAVNDAPTLGNGSLASVAEDTTNPAGQAVSIIFGGQFADIDAGSSFGGIAVVGNTANASTQGSWQYSSNGGSNWFAVGTVADGASALALSTSTLIRFAPLADFNGTPPALVVRGLDNTYAGGFSTTAGSETRVNVNTTSNGGTTAIAAATANLSTSITAVNDPPVITSNGGGATAAIDVNENTTVVTTVTSTDVDGGAAAYSILAGGDGAKFTINASTGVLSFLVAPDFENPSDLGLDNVYELTVRVSDGNGGFANQAIAVSVIDVADGIRVTPISVVPIGGETRVNTTTADIQTISPNVAQAVAVDAAGNFVVVWASNLQDGDAYGIYAQRFNADGTPQGLEFRVNTTTADNQNNPSVAMDGAGNFVVTWASNLQDGSGYGIYAQRYNASVVAQGAEFLVNATSAGGQTTPAIAMSPAGAFVITWSSSVQDPDGSTGIYAQRFNAVGAAQGGEFRVNTYFTDYQQLPSIAIDAAGNFVVTWASNGQDGSNYGVYGQRFDSSGAALGAEFRVNTTTAGSQLYNDVAMLPDGRFVLVFQSDNGGSRDLYLQRYAADGSAFGAEIRVNAVPGTVYFPIPSVSADAGGNITVVWNSNADGAGSGVFGRRFDWAGNTIGSEFQVNSTTAGNQQYPEVVAQPGGGFIVAWGGNGTGDADGVFLQRYGLTTTEAGGAATFQVVLETAPSADVVIPVSIVDGSEGTVSVATLTFTAANWNIAQTVTITGVQDYTNDGDIAYTVVLGTATSADPNFNGVNPADISVTNLEVANLAPVNTVPGAQSVNEDTALVFSTANGNAIAVGDVDAGGNPIRVTLSVSNGVLTLASVSGLSFASGANGSSTMTFTGTIADINTALDGLRFDPTGNFNGPALLSLTTNDQGNSGTGGAMSDFDSVAITVDPVNDAPVVTTTGGALAYTENQVATAIDTGLTVADIDSADLSGATITISANYASGQDVLAFIDQNGISGSWNTSTGVLTLSGTTTLANYEAALRSITYVNGSDDPSTLDRTIAFVVNDGALSSTAANRTVTLTTINDAPTLGNGTLSAVLEDTASPAGQSVATIFSGQFSDPDNGASLSGIAVVGNVANAGTQGSWQYSTNSGGNWFAIGAVADGATALTLSSSTLIRFVPVADYNGTPPALVVRGLDNTYVAGFSTTAGSESRVNVNTTSNGGTTAIAAATANLTTSITAVNDAPVRTAGTPTAINVSEDSANSTAVTLGLGGLAYGNGGGADEAGQALSYTVTAIPAHITLWLADGTTPVLANDTLTLTQLQGLQYKTVAEASGSANLSWTVQDNGGTANGGVDTLTENLAITVNAVNDAPVVTTTGGALAYTENQAATAIDPGLTVGDIDSSNLTGATVTISANYANGQDVLAFTDQLGITGSWNAGTGVLTLSGTAPLADYQTALRSVAYFNSSDDPDTLARTVSFVVNDGALNSTAATRTVTVTASNDAPTLGNGTLAAVLEDTISPAGQAVSTIFAGQFADLDTGASFSGIAVVGNTANAGTQGSWQYSSNGGGNWFAIGSVADGATALALDSATLIRFVPVADYNGSPPALVVRGLDNTYVGGFSSSAGSEARVNVDTTGNGGSTAIAAATANLSTAITAVNDAPVRTAGAPAAINVNEDSANTTAVSLGLGGLAYGNGGASDEAGQTLSYKVTVIPAHITLWLADGTTPVLANDTLTLTQLQGLQYKTVADTSGSANLSWTVQDDGGTANGGVDTLTENLSIAVNADNDAPVVTTSGGALAYAENQVATAVDAGITVADIDSANLTGATVSISANYANGQDLLAFTDQFGITGIWNAATGVLTLSGTAAVANYEAALRSVTYFNSSADPSTLARTVSYVVSDGALDSVAATRTIMVAAANDAPVVTTSGGLLAYAENQAASVIDAGLAVSDVDNANLAGATVSIMANFASGQDVLVFADQLGITGSWNASTGVLTLSGSATVADYQSALRSVTYFNSSDDPSTLTRTVGFVVNDGAANSSVATRTVTVTAINDAPTLGDGTLAAVPEDTVNPAGQAVSTIFAGQFADIDAGSSFSGIAVVGNTANAGTQGSWQYSTNAGGNWYAIGSVADDASALVLDSTTLIRFVPVADYNGTPPALLVRGLDNTYAAGFSSTSGSQTRVNVDTGSNGGTTAIAAATATLSTTITAVNDAPVLTDGGTSTATKSIDAAPFHGVATVADVDSADFDGGTLAASISAGGQATDTLHLLVAGDLTLSGADVLVSGVTVGSWSGGAGGAPLVVTFNANAGAAAVQTVYQAVTFHNTSANPTLGLRTISVVVTDGDGGSSNTGSGQVDLVNVAPAATNLSAAQTYTEDTPLDLADIVITDHEGDDVTVTLTLSNAAAGSLNTGTSGGVTSTYNAGTGVWRASGAIADVNALLAALNFAPTLDFNADFSIASSVSDGVAAPITGSKAITGTPVNDAPTTSPVTLAPIAEDSGARLITQAELLANAGDVDGDSLTATGLTLATGSGSLLDNGNGTWSFTPAGNDDTGVSFSYTITDGTASVAGSATLDITPVNDAPTTSAVTLASIAEDSGAWLITQAELLANATDVDGPSLTATNLAISAGSGSLVDNGNGTWSYTPALNDDTSVSFSYTVTDGTLTAAGSATLDITPVNDAPTTSPVTLAAIAEDSGPRLITQAELLANANDVDGPGLTVTNLTISSGLGSLVDNGNGTWSYTPALNDDTGVSFSYTITDGSLSVAGSATLDITPVNDAPTTSVVTLAPIAEDSGTRLITQAELLAHAADVDSPSLLAMNLAITTGRGNLVDNGNGTWTYTPAPNDDSGVSFSYTVTDGSLSVAGSATLDITPVNDAPTTSVVTLAPIAEDSGARLITQAELLANAADVDNPNLTATQLAISSGRGTLMDNGNGTWTFTPALDDDTAVSFGYTITDGSLSVAGSATLDITPVNDAPTLAMATLQLRAGQSVVLDSTKLQASDPDDAMANLSFVVAGVQFGRFEWVSAPGVAIQQFTQADVAAGRVRLASTSATEAPSFRLMVVDEQQLSAEITASIEFSRDDIRLTEAALPELAMPTSDRATTEARDAPTVVRSPAAPELSRSGFVPVASTLIIDPVDAALIRFETSGPQLGTPHEYGRSDRGGRGDDIGLDVGLAADDFLIRTFNLQVLDAEQASRSSLDAGLQLVDEGAPGSSTEENSSGLTLAATARMTGLALTAGTVWWALRAGGLLTGLLVSMPAWRHADLLAVLPDEEDDDTWDQPEDDEAARDEQAVGQVFQPAFEGEAR